MASALITNASENLCTLSLIAQIDPDVFGSQVFEVLKLKLEYNECELESIAWLCYCIPAVVRKLDLWNYVKFFHSSKV